MDWHRYYNIEAELILVNLILYALPYGAGDLRNGFLSTMDTPQNETIEIGPGNIKMSFSSTSGQLKRIYNTKTGVISFTVPK